MDKQVHRGASFLKKIKCTIAIVRNQGVLINNMYVIVRTSVFSIDDLNNRELQTGVHLKANIISLGLKKTFEFTIEF